MADDETLTRSQAKLITDAVAEAFKLFERGNPIKAPPVLAISENELRAIVREESSKVFDEKIKPFTDRIGSFIPADDIDNRIEERFEWAGLPIDREHREETGQAVRGVMKWQKRIDKIIGGIAIAFATAAIYGIAHMVGVNLPQLPTVH